MLKLTVNEKIVKVYLPTIVLKKLADVIAESPFSSLVCEEGKQWSL